MTDNKSNQPNRAARQRSRRHLQSQGWRWTEMAIIALTIGTVVLPIAYEMLRGSESAWSVAVAKRQHATGHPEAAIASLLEAQRDFPDDPQIPILLSRWQAEQGQVDAAVATIESAAQHMPGESEIAMARINVYQQTGHFQKAVPILRGQLLGIEALIQQNGPDPRLLDQKETALNNLAYFRSLANRRCKLGLKEIDTSIESFNKDLHSILPHPWGVKESMIAAVCSLNDFEFETDESSELIDAVLEYQIAHRLSELTQWQVELPESVTDVFESGDRPDPPQMSQLNLMREKHLETIDSLALLLAVRSLLAQQAGRQAESLRDRQYVLGLGLDPQQILDALPGAAKAIAIANRGVTYLDTRAYLNYRLKKLDTARQEIDLVALVVSTTNRLLADSQQTKISKADLVAFRGEHRLRQEAILRYHRMKILEAQDTPETLNAAKNEAARIRRLGFEPDERLN